MIAANILAELFSGYVDEQGRDIVESVAVPATMDPANTSASEPAADATTTTTMHAPNTTANQ